VVPGIEVAAAHFVDHTAYPRWVLHGAAPHFAAAETSHIETFDYLYGADAVLGAIGLAGVSLFGQSLREALPDAMIVVPRRALRTLRELHSGHIGDYIAWWTAGAAALGSVSLVVLK
jgi:multicomponent Na+:H+ antiporter subunit D